MPSTPNRAPTRLQQPAPSFDDLAKRLDIDINQLGNVGQVLGTLAQMIDRVRLDVDAADKALRVGTYRANPFADPRAQAGSGENIVDVLARNTESVYHNTRDSLVDLQKSLKDGAAATDRIAKRVHDRSQDSQKLLRQLMDTAFGAHPQGATADTLAARRPPKSPGAGRTT